MIQYIIFLYLHLTSFVFFFLFLCRLILVVLTDIYILFTIFFSALFFFHISYLISFRFVSVRVLDLCVVCRLCVYTYVYVGYSKIVLYFERSKRK